MFKLQARKIFTLILGSGIVLAIVWDLASSIHVTVQEGTFRKESDFPKTNCPQTDVAVVPSDYESLPSPTATTNPGLTYKQVEDMVRKAIELQGGLQGIVKPGDWVLIKPNIVNSGVASGSGEITDTRVIKAVIKIVHEFTGGNVKISVGEGAPIASKTEVSYSVKPSQQWKKLWDTAGYPELVSDPELAGIPFDTLNLNGTPPNNPWQDLEYVDVPGGGLARPHKGKYWLHKAVRQADVYINCPVLKIHNTGITSALKNQIGLAPCTKYGFYKTLGVPQLGNAVKLFHDNLWPCDWTEEEIVDLSNLAHIDLNVVDAILTLEKQKSLLKSNGVVINQVRFNTILAGKDPVAVDVVGSRLTGINPDDVDHICLASKIGLGTNDPEKIRVVGKSVDALKKRLKKSKTATRLIFGRSNRTWLLSPAFPVSGVSDPINHEFISGEANLEPLSGQNSWSEPIYFFDDRLDLGSYFNGANDVVSYAFSYFYAPRKQQAELWIGSDESLIVYLNHKPVYTFSGTRSYGNNTQLLSERPVITIEAGENTLLVKSLQRSGYYDFALNLCEVETDPELIGNRVAGLKFHTEPAQTNGVPSGPHSALPGRIVLAPNFPNPFNAGTTIRFDLPRAGSASLVVTSLTGRQIRKLADHSYSAGSHRVQWDGLDDRGEAVPTGVYLVTLRTGEGAVSRKLSMIK